MISLTLEVQAHVGQSNFRSAQSNFMIKLTPSPVVESNIADLNQGGSQVLGSTRCTHATTILASCQTENVKSLHHQIVS